MPAQSKLDRICNLLAEKYGDLGKGAAARLRHWISGEIPFACPKILERHLDEEHLDLLFDAFWQLLAFGTGGRRGRVGYGSNRLNLTSVGMTVQGHCDYLHSAFPGRSDLCVVVANDVRVFNDNAGVYRFLGDSHPLLGVSSRSLGRLACEIYTGNGITAYFARPDQDSALLTTPELSFLINRLGAVGGINLSASHNPPDDNGTKIYDQWGSQPVAPDDQHLVDIMEKATQIKRLAFQEARQRRLIRAVPQELHREYVQTYLDLYAGIYAPRPDLPVVYTPLCGCGLSTVGDVLQELGFPLLSPPEEGPDGSFKAIPFKAPNPEVPQATQPARRFAEEQGSEVVLSSDPDADRVGVEVRLQDGSWYHFDGNQIASVLCYYLMLDPLGPRRKGLVIETLVTTKILSAIVEKTVDSWIVDDLLVGFKYVAHVLKTLRDTGRYKHVSCSPDQLVLACEESHGVVMIPGILDKDATPACMYLAALYQRLKAQGRTLLDYYVGILEELGGYDSVNRSIMMSGAQGMLRKDRIMESLRQSPPETFGGQAVQKIVDYWDQEQFGPFVSQTDEPPRNVLQIFSEAFVITVRPSGTEPKLKLYCQLLPHGEPSGARGQQLLRQVRQRADAVARQVYNELLGRIGISLSEAGLMLTDIIDLDRKLEFERQTVPRLQRSLQNGDFSNLDQVLEWLRQQSKAMVAGSDPLPALKAPLTFLCRQWKRESSSSALLDEVLAWSE